MKNYDNQNCVSSISHPKRSFLHQERRLKSQQLNLFEIICDTYQLKNHGDTHV